MKIIRIATILSMSLILSSVSFSGLYAAEDNKSRFYLAIKGGVSLGSYETGINRAILKYVENDQNSELVSFSGASAGSVNSVLSAIDACIKDKTIDMEIIRSKKSKQRLVLDDTLDSNFMRTVWDLGIDDLVPTEDGENNYKSLYRFTKDKKKAGEVAIFSRKGFDNKKKIIEFLKNKEAIEGCEITLTMSVTKLKPYKYKVDEVGASIQLQRFVIPVDVYVDDNTLKFRNSKLTPFVYDKDSAIPSAYLHLVTDGEGEISFESLWDLAMASSAFPLAFHPVELSVCFPHELKNKTCTAGEAKTALFSDGGLFDNSPIGVAWDIASPDVGGSKRVKLIYINPDSYRTDSGDIREVSDRHNVGLFEYLNYFSDSFLTAHESEYKSSLDKILRDKRQSSSRIYYMTNRYHNLLADLHAHFGAFYAEEYRMHDYLVGIYDGINIIAQLECDAKPVVTQQQKSNVFSSGYQQCVRQEVLKWITHLQLDNKPVVDFLNYLYDSEYDKSLILADYQDSVTNIYIALSRSFGLVNRTDATNIKYDDYITNLRSYEDNIDVVKDSDLDKIINNGRTYTSRKISKMYENVLLMQDISSSCSTCEGSAVEAGIGKTFKVMEPVVDSYLSHHESNIWPKPMSGFWGLSFGFNVNQKNQVIAFDLRPKINWLAEYDLSLDLGLNQHLYGEELADDDYLSYSIGITRHVDNLLFPNWGLGFQHETEGDHVYDESLDSAYIKMGMLNEVFSIKYLYRLDEVKRFSTQTRDDSAFVLSVDISRLCQMAFSSICR